MSRWSRRVERVERVQRVQRVLLAALVAVLAACGTPTDPVPEDFAVAEEGLFRVAHPPGWERGVDSATQLEAHDPNGDGPVPLGLSVQTREGFSGSFDHVVVLAMTSRRQAEGFTIVREEDVAVDGAERARLVESTWQVAEDGETVEARSVDLFAQRGEDLVYLSVIGPDAEWDAAQADAIAASFALP